MNCRPCRECGFWVTPQDRHCPDCGAVSPHSAAEREGHALFDGPAGRFLGAFLGLFIGGMTRIPLLVLLCVVAGALLGPRLARSLRRKSPSARAASSLAQSEATIRQRLEELQERGRRLVDVMRRVEAEEPAEHWQALQREMSRAAGALQRQRERYRARLWEIELVRWQNMLEALASDWDHLSHEECDRRLQLLETARRRGEALLLDWERADIAGTADAQDCLQRLRRALEGCEPLRQALVAQQAVLAVKGVVPLSEGMRPVPPPAAAALAQVERLNGRAALNQFSATFSQLESEYSRLHSDTEVTRQVEQLQRRG